MSCGDAAPGRSGKRSRDARMRGKTGLGTQGQDAVRSASRDGGRGRSQKRKPTQQGRSPRRSLGAVSEAARGARPQPGNTTIRTQAHSRALGRSFSGDATQGAHP
eukprot:1847197-Alexandrium_andersonii.AAC.1